MYLISPAIVFLLITNVHAQKVSAKVDAFSSKLKHLVLDQDLLDVFDFQPYSPKQIASAFYDSLLLNLQKHEIAFKNEPELVRVVVQETSDCLSPIGWVKVYGNCVGRILEDHQRLLSIGSLCQRFVRILSSEANNAKDPKQRIFATLNTFAKYLLSENVFSAPRVWDVFSQELISVSGIYH